MREPAERFLRLTITVSQYICAYALRKCGGIEASAWLEERQIQQIDGSLAAELAVGEREAMSLALEKADVLTD